MALIDRVLGAARPLNSVELASPQRTVEPARLLHGAKPPAARAARQADPAPAYASEPEAIARAYYVEERGDERRYYDDYRRQALAMRADATRISSRREDLDTIRAMLVLAGSRGWQTIKLSGSAEFRREAWIESQARGIAAQGYKPSDPDRQEAIRRRAERGPDAPTAAGPAKAPAAAVPVTANAVAPLHRVKVRPFPRTEAHTPQASARKARTGATTSLSADGKLVMAALSEKIERQMDKLSANAKAELKAFAAGELARKERTEGPVALTARQRDLAKAPAPARSQAATVPARAEPRRVEIEPPRRSRGR